MIAQKDIIGHLPCMSMTYVGSPAFHAFCFLIQDPLLIVFDYEWGIKKRKEIMLIVWGRKVIYQNPIITDVRVLVWNGHNWKPEESGQFKYQGRKFGARIVEVQTGLSCSYFSTRRKSPI